MRGVSQKLFDCCSRHNDLLSYMRVPDQTCMPIMHEVVKCFCNGRDLLLLRRRKFNTSVQPAKAYEGESIMMCGPRLQ